MRPPRPQRQHSREPYNNPGRARDPLRWRTLRGRHRVANRAPHRFQRKLYNRMKQDAPVKRLGDVPNEAGPRRLDDWMCVLRSAEHAARFEHRRGRASSFARRVWESRGCHGAIGSACLRRQRDHVSSSITGHGPWIGSRAARIAQPCHRWTQSIYRLLRATAGQRRGAEGVVEEAAASTERLVVHM